MATEIEYLVRCIMNLLPTYKEKKKKKTSAISIYERFDECRRNNNVIL